MQDTLHIMHAGDCRIAGVDHIRELESGEEVLDFLEERFRSMGAKRFLAAGIPLPGRPLAPLTLRANWGEDGEDESTFLNISYADPVLQRALRSKRPFDWPTESDGLSRESTLVALAGPSGEAKLAGVLVDDFLPYQACVLGAGPEFSPNHQEMSALDHICTQAFSRLIDLNFIRRERPGDLSARERRVVELSALGKTANDIASLLRISQRTVHAHLQNASGKMRAGNKTQTVVEALIYGQIDI